MLCGSLRNQEPAEILPAGVGSQAGDDDPEYLLGPAAPAGTGSLR